MIRSILIRAIFLMLLILYPCFAVPIHFPPETGPYTGDYVFIQEPGRYTLEGNISHTYPVGVIISSSSVILDGQGFGVSPVSTGGPSVGIWVTLTDSSGEPVTGVRIQNCTISNEVAGIYLEGIDSSEFPWGSDHSSDKKAKDALNTERKVTCSGVTISGCRTGITSSGLDNTEITQSDIRKNEKGLLISGGYPDIRDLVVSENQGTGISLSDTTGGEMTRCRIEANADAGILLKNSTDLKVWNNILDNPANIRNAGSSGITLYQELINQTNIIQGALTGGNLWAHGGIPVYVLHEIPDANLDGIGDIPYTESGFEDKYPLVPHGSGYSPEEIRIVPNQSPIIMPVPVSTPSSIITGIHAAIVGDTIPSEMKAGTTYPVSITLQNDGSDDWQNIHAVGIRATGAAVPLGPEWLPVPSVVNSKQSYTFIFDLKAPSDPGTYELTYQAARGGQGVSVTFGRPYKKVVTVK